MKMMILCQREKQSQNMQMVLLFICHTGKQNLHCIAFTLLYLFSEKQSVGTFNKKTFILTSSELNGSPCCSAFHFSAMPPSTAVIGQRLHFSVARQQCTDETEMQCNPGLCTQHLLLIRNQRLIFDINPLLIVFTKGILYSGATGILSLSKNERQYRLYIAFHIFCLVQLLFYQSWNNKE